MDSRSLLSKWNNKIKHHRLGGSLSMIGEYAYKFLVYAYNHNVPIEFVHDDGRNSSWIDTVYDMYSLKIVLDKYDPSKFFEDHYIQMKIRSSKQRESKRAIIGGVYEIYLGNPLANEECNCSFFDICMEPQKHNIDYQKTLAELIERICKNDNLNAWLLLQGINVRNIL